LASQAQGYGNLALTLEQQAAFVEEAPEIFLPIPGGWGRMGYKHIRLAAANEDILTAALRTAWKLRIEKNAKKSRQGAGLAVAAKYQIRSAGGDDRQSVRALGSAARNVALSCVCRVVPRSGILSKPDSLK